MRRFTQRNSLVTLSDINITPLLDLAFVLLIIFVITTPLLEQSIPLKLPQGGGPDQKLDPRDIKTVEITPQGKYYLNKQPMASLEQLASNLAADFRFNPNMVVYIRADENGRNKDLYAVIDCCQKNGIKRFSFRTDGSKSTPKRR